ncbi:hypothetical protein FO439_00670 [Weissella cibaria]|uniref:Uncharacterized protein n=1 Tax=Weissella cibaria TaxID=137591 RepID=A0A9Q8N850_9LACO|nr:hypothetical protein [Weissella cibaria]QDG81212.1 hypothetical protein Wei3612_07540 [Weissella cibaria]TVV26518.1 hypothetical protein FO435_00660 [Weissella cibaria]TVV35236.1 hypothetical protein FO439_00670 [Weissella cibaria]TVV39714.1 hypothetical protein FO438_00495 [Weissella cibaria]UNW38829.1 hypothetical protein HUW87_00340 [Weissella cibaria]
MDEAATKIQELTEALASAQAEVDKWRTGAEIYEAQVGDLQGALQEMAAELDRLALENQQLKGQLGDAPILQPQASVPTDEDVQIIQAALISRIKELERALAQQ